MFDATQEFAHALDRDDPLARFREEFYLQPGRIYLDGNSLGLLSRRAERSLGEIVESWKIRGIDGWTEGGHPWFYLSERLGALAAPLLGAEPPEVIVTGSTTVNLHQLLATFYRPAGRRTKILADELAFPSDIYAIAGQLRLRGLDPAEHLLRVPSRDGRTLEEEDILAAMTGEVAVAVLPTVLYRSGQLLDAGRIAAEARRKGVLLGLDASHSVGAVPHAFDEWGVDFAVWCGYKYLNGGPGAVGGLYVNRRHFGALPGLAGWFGSDKERQFDMEHEFAPAEGAGAYQIGTPHILSAAPLIGALEMFAEAGIGRLREKSLRLTEYMMRLIEHELAGMGFRIGNPREEERRGGHVALEHERAPGICRALKERGVVPDFRAPDVIRLAPAPLYVSFADVWEAVRRLKEIMTAREYRRYDNRRGVVA
ncbi:kynureninase [Rubrobacter taiwanensis]|jgi:kynureninase|uniref:Kynureninase n=1 Tax=Rubrobacter taiwanensis TaxID=185139 RepID=A0A4R1BI55_9ACTN|nr:kynureninase [Rubrobacter taiwanensis]TCJ16943.1 kynureninase [Rubrobacter taiwanensis]